MKIGVLALQGGFSDHIEALNRVINDDEKYSSFRVILVRCAEELKECKGLIIPGGESTSLSSLLESDTNLRESLYNFCDAEVVWGTCAGLILLSLTDDENVKTFGKIKMKIERNSYGRQKSSFIHDINTLNTHLEGKVAFIRAPRIKEIESESIEILATLDSDIVAVETNNLMGTTFHPELIKENTSWHKYFLDKLYNYTYTPDSDK
eukprot:TRINITY_DN1879_c0_g1_i2.p1 TRINITY_DN1879_c0_g1~~TRINITY_DN1879_c0_g1_i2.p1  ORF type:complete len:207 (+),score=45.52 TRINITY_DN1879_c0_g1_i2:1035-1655(+)